MLNVSLVGYTNAGKSTLFNALTKAGVYAADQLFATSTPPRAILGRGAGNIVISDTVGFIRDLPHSLVTRLSTPPWRKRQADLLLHVVDSANHARDEQMAEVNKVLAEIGADRCRKCSSGTRSTSPAPGRASSATNMVKSARPRQCPVGEGLELLRGPLAEYARGQDRRPSGA